MGKDVNGQNARAQDYAVYVNWVRSGWTWKAPYRLTPPTFSGTITVR
jgi:hypothetical protein